MDKIDEQMIIDEDCTESDRFDYCIECTIVEDECDCSNCNEVTRMEEFKNE